MDYLDGGDLYIDDGICCNFEVFFISGDLFMKKVLFSLGSYEEKLLCPKVLKCIDGYCFFCFKFLLLESAKPLPDVVVREGLLVKEETGFAALWYD